MKKLAIENTIEAVRWSLFHIHILRFYAEEEALSRIKVFAGYAGRQLAREICRCISNSPGEANISRFADGEVRVDNIQDVRGHQTFIVQPTHPPAENLIEVVLLAAALRNASAEQVTLVLPYLGYNRQDRRIGRAPISAREIVRMLSRNCDQVLLVDLHSEPTMGFFDVPTDHLYASPVLLPAVRPILGENFVVGAPDKGATPRARAYAYYLGQEEGFVVFDKARSQPGELKKGSIRIIGDVKDKVVLLCDDIIDTAGTVVEDAAAAMEAGAKGVVVAAAHGLFSKDALERIAKSAITKVVVTDTITHPPEKLARAGGRVEVVSIAPYLAEAIRRISDGESLEPLRNRKQ